ncbi:membrane-associated protein, putative, partial [Bodo saltans]
MATALYILVYATAVLHWFALAVADRTTLSCTTDIANTVISIAGRVASSEWFLLVAGCASNGTNSNGVSIRLFNSPTQTIVTDNATLLPSNTTNTTLAGCSVDITFLPETVVPIASSNVTYPPVYVSSTSFMGNISVVLLATLYLERNFIFVTGNYSGGIESIALRCAQGSSIVCPNSTTCSPFQPTRLCMCPQRPSWATSVSSSSQHFTLRGTSSLTGNYSGGIESIALRCAQGSSIVCPNSTTCSPFQGTSLILLAPGCPQIGALSVLLDGTNVTGSMWLRTLSTSPSYFSFVLIDNFTFASVTPAPRASSIVMRDVQGMMVLSLVVCVRQQLVGVIPVIDWYDMGHLGSVSLENCRIATPDSPSNYPIFPCANPVAIRIVLINISCSGFFLSALSTATSDTSSDTSALWSVNIRIVNSSMRSTTRFLYFSVPNPFNGTVIRRNVLSMIADNSTFRFDGSGSEMLLVLLLSVISGAMSLMIATSILFSQCTINTTVNSIPLLYTLSPNQAQPLPILHNSSIVFEDSQVYQTWETYVNYFGTVFPPVPLIQADLNATSIVFARCNIFVQQVSSPTTPAVALLLSVTNVMTTSSLHFINSSITVAANITSPLRTFPISVNAMSSSNITLTNTTLTNIVALVQLLNTSSPLNSNAIVDVGCSNSWCAPVDNRP